MEWPYVIEGERTDAAATLAPEGGGAGRAFRLVVTKTRCFLPPVRPGVFGPPGRSLATAPITRS